MKSLNPATACTALSCRPVRLHTSGSIPELRPKGRAPKELFFDRLLRERFAHSHHPPHHPESKGALREVGQRPLFFHCLLFCSPKREIFIKAVRWAVDGLAAGRCGHVVKSKDLSSMSTARTGIGVALAASRSSSAELSRVVRVKSWTCPEHPLPPGVQWRYRA